MPVNAQGLVLEQHFRVFLLGVGKIIILSLGLTRENLEQYLDGREGIFWIVPETTRGRRVAHGLDLYE